ISSIENGIQCMQCATHARDGASVMPLFRGMSISKLPNKQALAMSIQSDADPMQDEDGWNAHSRCVTPCSGVWLPTRKTKKHYCTVLPDVSRSSAQEGLQCLVNPDKQCTMP